MMQMPYIFQIYLQVFNEDKCLQLRNCQPTDCHQDKVFNEDECLQLLNCQPTDCHQDKGGHINFCSMEQYNHIYHCKHDSSDRLNGTKNIKSKCQKNADIEKTAFFFKDDTSDVSVGLQLGETSSYEFFNAKQKTESECQKPEDIGKEIIYKKEDTSDVSVILQLSETSSCEFFNAKKKTESECQKPEDIGKEIIYKKEDISVEVAKIYKRSGREEAYLFLKGLVPSFKEDIKFAKSIEICFKVPKYSVPVFLVETATFKGKLVWRGIDVFCFIENEVSPEGKNVFPMETGLSNEYAIEVSKIIQETQEQYAERHSNITVISASRFKSISFEKNGTLKDKICIVFYCRRKGFIPFLEDLFPTHIKNIPTDVREGIIEAAAGIRYFRVRNGLEISAIGSKKCGTLGPIFDDPITNCPCALINAHVALSDDKMWALVHNIKSISDNVPIYVANPPMDQKSNQGNDERIFGVVQQSAITKGGGFEAGTDVSVVKINSRFPDCGYFPDDSQESLNEIGYSTSYPPLYQGEMQKNIEKWRFHDVIKFGAATRWTRGVPYLTSVFTRRCNFSPDGPLKYTLCNQIEIKSLKGSEFGKAGDSGSTIFYRREEDNQLVAVAILNGVTSYGSAIASPIGDCLKSVHLENLKHFKRFPGRKNLSNPTSIPNVCAVGPLLHKPLPKESEYTFPKDISESTNYENSENYPCVQMSEKCPELISQHTILKMNDSGYDALSSKSTSMTLSVTDEVTSDHLESEQEESRVYVTLDELSLSNSTMHHIPQQGLSYLNAKQSADAKYPTQASNTSGNHLIHRDCSINNVHRHTHHTGNTIKGCSYKDLQETSPLQLGSHLHDKNSQHNTVDNMQPNNSPFEVINELAGNRERILMRGIDTIAQMVQDYVKNEREYAKHFQNQTSHERFQTN